MHCIVTVKLMALKVRMTAFLDERLFWKPFLLETFDQEYCYPFERSNACLDFDFMNSMLF